MHLVDTILKKRKLRFVIFCRHSAIISVDVSSTILHGPHNRTSFTQSTVKFRCTSDGQKDIYWKYKAVPGDSTVYIFDRFGRNKKLFDARFVKTVNGSTSVLTIHNVSKSDAGTYLCRENNSASHWSAQLSVVG